MAYGASIEDWSHFDLILGLGEDLLPVVSNPNAKISETSKMKGLGKTPSLYRRDNTVIGLAAWTQRRSTSDEITAWSQEPDYGICLQTRRVRALDIDVDDASISGKILKAFQEALGLQMPVRTRSNSGKQLAVFIVQGDMGKRSFKCEGGLVEFLATGQQFIACGTHPSGARYDWDSGLPDLIPTITLEQFEDAWTDLVGMFAIEPVREAVRRDLSGTGEQAQDDVADWLEENWETYGARAGKLFVECPWKDGHSSDSGETEAAWLIAGTRGFQRGHFECLHASCSGRADDEFLDAVGYRLAQFDVIEMPEPRAAAPGAPVVWDPDAPRLPLPNMLRDKSGQIEAIVGNVQKAVNRPDATGMDIRYDEFRGEIIWSIPGSGAWQRWEDHHYTALRLRLEQLAFKPVGRELIRDMVLYRAKDNRIDTAMVWLDSLSWDGVSRVGTFFPTYFGTDDTAYTRAVSTYIWTAMASRVLSPGSKVDMVPVLVGAQGQRKSWGISAMVPSEDHFAEFDLTSRDADMSRKMRGTLMGELAELRGINSRDAESIKAWLTQRHERWTPKYLEMETVFPRRLVFIGTSNQREFLSDETGNRRWLPVVSGSVQVEQIIADRDQLWAEAAALFTADGLAWAHAEALARDIHDDFRVVDEAWETPVMRWLADVDVAGTSNRDRTDLTTHTIMSEALGLDAKNCKRADQVRICKILQVCGMKQVFYRVSAKTARVWRSSEGG